MNDEMQLTTTQHSLQYVDPAAVAAAEGAKARIQAMFLMALHKTRNFDQSRSKILDAFNNPSSILKSVTESIIGNQDFLQTTGPA